MAKKEPTFEEEKEEVLAELESLKGLVEAVDKTGGLNRPSKELKSEYLLVGQMFITATKGTEDENTLDLETLQALADCCPDAQLMRESIAEMKDILKQHGVTPINFARA